MVVDYAGAVTEITGQLTTALTAGLPILGIVLGVVVGIAFFKRMAKGKIFIFIFLFFVSPVQVFAALFADRDCIFYLESNTSYTADSSTTNYLTTGFHHDDAYYVGRMVKELQHYPDEGSGPHYIRRGLIVLYANVNGDWIPNDSYTHYERVADTSGYTYDGPSGTELPASCPPCIEEKLLKIMECGGADKYFIDEETCEGHCLPDEDCNDEYNAKIVECGSVQDIIKWSNETCEGLCSYVPQNAGPPTCEN